MSSLAPRLYQRLHALATAVGLLLTPISLAHGECPSLLGDITEDQLVNVVDVQCSILSTLWTLGGEESSLIPACTNEDPMRSDINCVEGVNVH